MRAHLRLAAAKATPSPVWQTLIPEVREELAAASSGKEIKAAARDVRAWESSVGSSVKLPVVPEEAPCFAACRSVWSASERHRLQKAHAGLLKMAPWLAQMRNICIARSAPCASSAGRQGADVEIQVACLGLHFDLAAASRSCTCPTRWTAPPDAALLASC